MSLLDRWKQTAEDVLDGRERDHRDERDQGDRSGGLTVESSTSQTGAAEAAVETADHNGPGGDTMARARDRATAEREDVRSERAADQPRQPREEVEDPNRIGEGAIDPRDGRAAPSEEDLSSKTDFEGVPDPTSRAGGDGEAFDPHDLDVTPGHDGHFAGEPALGGDPFSLDVDGDALAAESHGGVPDLPGAGNSVADPFDAGLDTEVPDEYSLAGNEAGDDGDPALLKAIKWLAQPGGDPNAKTGKADGGASGGLTAINPAPEGYVVNSDGTMVPEGSPEDEGGNATTVGDQRAAVAAGATGDGDEDDDDAAGTGAPASAGPPAGPGQGDEDEDEDLGVVAVGATGVGDAIAAAFSDDDPEQKNTEKAEEVHQSTQTDDGAAADAADADDADSPDDTAEDHGADSQTFGRSPSMDDEIGETYFEIQQGALGGSEVQYADQPSSGGSEPLDYDGVDYGGEHIQPVDDIPADVVTAALYNGGDIDPHEDPTASFTGGDDSADAATAAADDGGDAAEVMEG